MRQNRIKYKYLTLDELIINIDRLSRFKLPEESYFRVFSSVLLKCLISPKYSKSEIENLDAKIISEITMEIWNNSVENLFGKSESEFNILKAIAKSEFKNFDEKTKILLNTNLKIKYVLKKINYETAPLNLKFLIKTSMLSSFENVISFSRKNKLMFPVNKLIIAEGITEEILLPVFAEKLNKSFYSNGIYILGAGGKSKSPALYMKLKDKVKIPIILLFDSDAKEICSVLKKQLAPKDKIIIIDKGEFEDVISPNLLKRSLNKEYEPIDPILIDELRVHKKMCENIEDFYRTRHLGEFKKSKLSKIIASNVKYDSDITDEIKNIISQIV